MSSINIPFRRFEEEEEEPQLGFASPASSRVAGTGTVKGWSDLNEEQQQAIKLYNSRVPIPQDFSDPFSVSLRNRQMQRFDVEGQQKDREGVGVLEAMSRFGTQFMVGVRNIQGTQAGSRNYHQFNILDLASKIRSDETTRQQLVEKLKELEPESDEAARYNIGARLANVSSALYPNPAGPMELPQAPTPETVVELDSGAVKFSAADIKEALRLAEKGDITELDEEKVAALQEKVSEDERQLAIAAFKAPTMERGLEEFLLSGDISDPEFYRNVTELLDPSNVIELAAQSMPMQGIGLVAGFGFGLGTFAATRNPVAARTVGGLAGGGATYVMEYNMESTALLLEAGAPLFDVAAMKNWIADNRDLYADIQRDADIRAGIIAAGEAVSMGVAGLTKAGIIRAQRALRMKRAMQKAQPPKALGGPGFLTAEIAMQGVTAGAAEALAAVAQGEEVMAGEVAVEAWLEAILGGTTETLAAGLSTSLPALRDQKASTEQRRKIAEWLTSPEGGLSTAAVPVMDGVLGDLNRLMQTPVRVDEKGNVLNRAAEDGAEAINLRGPESIFQPQGMEFLNLAPVAGDQVATALTPGTTEFQAGTNFQLLRAVTDEQFLAAGVRQERKQSLTEEQVQEAIEAHRLGDKYEGTYPVHENLSIALNLMSPDGNWGPEKKMTRGEVSSLGWNPELRGYVGDFEKLLNVTPLGLAESGLDGRAYFIHVDRGVGRHSGRVFVRAGTSKWLNNVEVFDTPENGGVEQAIAWLSNKFEKDAELATLRAEREKFFAAPENQEQNRQLVERVEKVLNFTLAKRGNEWTRSQGKIEWIDPVSGDVRYTYKTKVRNKDEYRERVALVNFRNPEKPELLLTQAGSKAVEGSTGRKTFVVNTIRNALGLGKYSSETGQPFKPAIPSKGSAEARAKEAYYRRLSEPGVTIEEAKRLAEQDVRAQDRMYNMLIAEPTQALVNQRQARKDELKKEIAALKDQDEFSDEALLYLERELEEVNQYLESRAADSPQRREGVEQRRWPKEWTFPVHPLDESGKADIRVYVAKADIQALRDTLKNKDAIVPYVTVLMGTGDKQVREVRVFLDIDPKSESYGQWVAEAESENGLQYDSAVRLGVIEGLEFPDSVTKNNVIDRLTELHPYLTSNERRRSARAKAMVEVMALRRRDRQEGRYDFGTVGFSTESAVTAGELPLPSAVTQRVIGTGRQTEGWVGGRGDRAFEDAMEAGLRAERQLTALPEPKGQRDRTFSDALEFRTDSIALARQNRNVAQYVVQFVGWKSDKVFQDNWTKTKGRMADQEREVKYARTRLATLEKKSRRADSEAEFERLADEQAAWEEKLKERERKAQDLDNRLEAFAIAEEMRQQENPQQLAEMRLLAAESALSGAKSAKESVAELQGKSNKEKTTAQRRKDIQQQIDTTNKALLRLEDQQTERLVQGQDESPELEGRIRDVRARLNRLEKALVELGKEPSPEPKAEEAEAEAPAERTPRRSNQLNRMRARRAAQREFQEIAQEVFQVEFLSKIAAGEQPMSYDEMTAEMKLRAGNRLRVAQGLFREERNRYLEGDNFTIRSFLPAGWQVLTEEQAIEKKQREISQSLDDQLRAEFEAQNMDDLVEQPEPETVTPAATMDGIPIPGERIRRREMDLTRKLDSLNARIEELAGSRDPGRRAEAARLRGERAVLEGELASPENAARRRIAEIEAELEALPSAADTRTTDRRIRLNNERTALLREVEQAAPDTGSRIDIIRKLGQETVMGETGAEITPEGWRLLNVMTGTDKAAAAERQSIRSLENWWVRNQGTTLESYLENVEIMAEIMDMTPDEVRRAAANEIKEAYRRAQIAESAAIAKYAEDIKVRAANQEFSRPVSAETVEGTEGAADIDAMLQAELDALYLVIDADDFDLSVNASIHLARMARLADLGAQIRNTASIVYPNQEMMEQRAKALNTDKYRKLRFEAAQAKERGDAITYDRKVKAMAAAFQEEMNRLDLEKAERERMKVARREALANIDPNTPDTFKQLFDLYMTGPAHLLLEAPKPRKTSLPDGVGVDARISAWLETMLAHSWVNYHGFSSTIRQDLGWPTGAWVNDPRGNLREQVRAIMDSARTPTEVEVAAPVHSTSIVDGVNKHGAKLATLLVNGAALNDADASWVVQSRAEAGVLGNLGAEVAALTGGGGRFARAMSRAGSGDSGARRDVETPSWGIISKWMRTDRGLPKDYKKYANLLNTIGAIANNDVVRVRADFAILKNALSTAGIPYDVTTNKAINLYLENHPRSVAEDVLGAKFPKEAIEVMDRIVDKIAVLSARLSDNMWSPLHVRARIDERGKGYLHASTNIKSERSSLWRRLQSRAKNFGKKPTEVNYIRDVVGKDVVDELVKAVFDAAGLPKDRQYLSTLTKAELAFRLNNTYGITTIPNSIGEDFTVKGRHAPDDNTAIDAEGMIDFIMSHSFDTSHLETRILRQLEEASREYAVEQGERKTATKESAFKARQQLRTEREQNEFIADLWLKPEPVEDQGRVSDILRAIASKALAKDKSIENKRAEADRLRDWLRKEQNVNMLFNDFTKNLVKEFPWTKSVVEQARKDKKVNDAWRKALFENVSAEARALDTVSRLALVGERNRVLQQLFQQLADDGYLMDSNVAPTDWEKISGESDDGASILNAVDFSLRINGQEVTISSDPTGSERTLKEFSVPPDFKWSIKSLMNDLPKSWLTARPLSGVNALTKYTLVITNPAAHPRNFWSTTMIGFARGTAWTPGSRYGEGMKKATKIALRQLGAAFPHTLPFFDFVADAAIKKAAESMGSVEQANVMERNLVRVLSAGDAAGVLGDGARARALLDIIQHARINGRSLTAEQAESNPQLWGEYLLEMMDKGRLDEIATADSTVWQSVKQRLEQWGTGGKRRSAEVLRFFEESFRLEDEAIKIAGFMKYARFFAELKGLDPALIDKYLSSSLDDRGVPTGQYDMTQDEINSVRSIFEMTGNHVKDLYPTYSRVPEIARWLNRQVFIGAFPSFQFEMARNTWKQGAYMINMLRGRLPDGTVLEGKARTYAKMHAMSMLPAFISMGLASNVTLGLARRALAIAGGGDEDDNDLPLYATHDWAATAMTGPWNRHTSTYFTFVDPETGDYGMRNLSYLNPAGGQMAAMAEMAQEIQNIIDQYGDLSQIDEGSPAWAMLEWQTFKPIMTMLGAFGFRDEVFVSRVMEKWQENLRTGGVKSDPATVMQAISSYAQRLGVQIDEEELTVVPSIVGPIMSALIEALPAYEMLDQGEALAESLWSGDIDSLVGFVSGGGVTTGNLYEEGVQNLYFRLGDLKIAHRNVFNQLQTVLEGENLEQAVAKAYLAEQDRQRAANEVYLFLRAARTRFDLDAQQALGLLDLASTGKYSAVGSVEEVAGMSADQLVYGEFPTYDPEALMANFERMDGLTADQKMTMRIAINRLSEYFQ